MVKGLGRGLRIEFRVQDCGLGLSFLKYSFRVTGDMCKSRPAMQGCRHRGSGAAAEGVRIEGFGLNMNEACVELWNAGEIL